MDTIETPRGKAAPVFCVGQSVLQLWACWFKHAKQAPEHYRKKDRPAWFSGEICNPPVYMKDFKYAGVLFTGWTYAVH